MAEPGFQAHQFALADHLRDPSGRPPPPGLPADRLQVYRELFIGNLQGLLAGSFYVLRSLYSEAGWEALVRDFYAEHPCRTPLFHHIAREFVDYLDKEREARPDDPPFLAELAHYEWVELDLDVAPEEAPLDGVDPGGDLGPGRPVLSPLVRVLAYEFPVHRIGPGFQPSAPAEEPTWLVAWRDGNEVVRFSELNPLSARLLWCLREAVEPGAELVARVARECGVADDESMVRAGLDQLRQWREQTILLGTQTDRGVEPT